MNYDPNVIHKFATQTVRLTLGMWEYRKTIEVKVGGNCKGITIIRAAVGRAIEEMYGDNEYASVTLEHPEHGELLCEDDDGHDEDWLEDFVIAAEIIAVEPATVKGET